MTVEKLRSWRMKLRSSQHTVAKLAGISRNRLSLIECGYAKTTGEELRRIQIAINKIDEETQKSKFFMVRKIWRVK